MARMFLTMHDGTLFQNNRPEAAAEMEGNRGLPSICATVLDEMAERATSRWSQGDDPRSIQAGETYGDCKNPAWTGQVRKKRLVGEAIDMNTGGKRKFGLK